MSTADPPIKDIVLYHYPVTRSARIRWLLLELNVPHKVIKVDLVNAANHSKEFLEKNPNHNVPMLEFTICKTGERRTMLESGAMIIYLSDIFTLPNGKKLAPSINEYDKRSDYLQMILFGASWMDMILWQIRMHTHLLPYNLREESVIKYYKTKWKNEIEPQLRKRILKHKYMLGNEFSSIDILMGYNLMWANGYKILTDPVLIKYLKMLFQRKKCKQTFADRAAFALVDVPSLMNKNKQNSKL